MGTLYPECAKSGGLGDGRRMRDDECGAQCSTGVGGTAQAFLRSDRPIRCRVAKPRVSGGTLGIHGITSAIFAAVELGVGDPLIFRRRWLLGQKTHG